MIEGWTTYKLNDVALIETGGNAPQGVEYFTSNGLPFVRVQHFDGNKVYVDRFDYITDEAVKKYRLKSFPKESILFPKSGASINLEKRAKLPFDAFVVSHIAVLIAKENVNNDFLYYWTKTQKFSVDQSGSTLPYLNIANLKERKILLPPLPEQRKIAYILSTVQKAIEQQDKLIRTTTELKKALMQKLFTEGIGWLSGVETRQKQTEIGLVPESWEVVELGDVCARISINVQPNPNGNKPYVGLEHIFSGQIYLTDWGTEKEVVSSKAAFKKGYILYGKLRPYLDKAVIAPFDGISSTDILIFNGKNEVENDFLIHFFHTDKFIEFAKSTTSGVQHPRTSWTSLKKIKLGLPLKSERKFIAKTLNIIENKIQFHQKKKQTLSALFKTLLHELMTGQRRVHSLNFDLND